MKWVWYVLVDILCVWWVCSGCGMCWWIYYVCVGCVVGVVCVGEYTMCVVGV